MYIFEHVSRNANLLSMVTTRRRNSFTNLMLKPSVVSLMLFCNELENTVRNENNLRAQRSFKKINKDTPTSVARFYL
jgi:hypothetical protein